MPPERWLELTVRGPDEAGVVCELFMELGGGAVEERDGGLVTYLPPPRDVQSLLDAVQARLHDLWGDQEMELTWRWQPHEDWEDLWRRGLGLRRITPRLLVAPSWEKVEPAEGELLLRIDPGLAFGTAEHATTRGCLGMLDRTIHPGDRVADVGAGSGILAIAAARLGAEEVRAFEMDAMACETARENVKRNAVEGRVVVEELQVGERGPLPGAPFHGLVGNLQTHLILPLLPGFRSSLAQGGWAVLSGIFMDEEETLVPAAAAQGFFLQQWEKEEGWWTGLFNVP
ncbi:MAG: 50S ribosomal protein L11 methyltransferase [Gemmatimonadota bacterium]|jgi:ribosomal protein L11 methyltransferase